MGSESNRGAQGRGRVQGKRMVFARRFTLAAVLVAVLASLAFDCGIGTPSSFGIGQFNLLCPLGGLEAMLASKAFIPVAAISAGVLLLFALVFGRAWCAWGCPAPVIRRFFKRDPKPAKPGACASSCAACSGAKAALDVKASPAFLARDKRTWTLAAVLVCAIVAGLPLFCLVCPIGLTFGTVGSLWHLIVDKQMTASVVVFPAALAVELVLYRKWCMNLCPVAGLLGIFGQFAAFLYFVGVGIPPELRLFFIAALPLISALLLTMGNPDPFQAADDNAGESVARGSFEWRAYRKLVAAAAIVAFTAGVGKGIASMIGNVDLFARSGTIAVFCVGLIAVAIVAVVNRGDAVRGARSVYSGLIVLGIAMMLATCFGFDISFLSIGKECLWMVFSCFMAYLAFRYDFSAVRVFGIGQGAYFTASLVGWATGAALQPYYQDGVVRMGVGMVLAFLVVLVLVYVFQENDLKRIMARSVDSEAEAARVRLAAAAAPACPAGACATCPANGVPASFGAPAPGEGAALAGQAADGEGDAGAAAAPQASAAPQSPAAAPAAQQPPFAQLVANMFGAAGASDPAEPVPAAVPGNPADPVYGLSTRELEILDLFAQGRSANWIAEHLTISKNTVRTHLRAIYSKLDVHSRQELLDFLAGKRSEGE